MGVAAFVSSLRCDTCDKNASTIDFLIHRTYITYAAYSTDRSSIPRSTILRASSSEKNHSTRQGRSKSNSHPPSNHELKCRHAHFGIGVSATNNEEHASPSTSNTSNCRMNSLGTLATDILSLEKKFLLEDGSL